MSKLDGKCLGTPITIREDRTVVLCDELSFTYEWKEGDGYFLLRLADGMVCVGWVDGINHEMNVEFRGSDPHKLIKEVTRQEYVDKPHAAYIASEIMIAYRCLVDGTEYIQR